MLSVLETIVSIVTLYLDNEVSIFLILVIFVIKMIVNRVGVKVEMKNNNSGTAVGYVGISYSYVSSLKIELQSW